MLGKNHFQRRRTTLVTPEALESRLLFALSVFGDLNGDQARSTADIDRLNEALFSKSDNITFDLSGDQQVNSFDRDWLLTIMGSGLGDANLDHTTNFSDFLVLSQHFGAAGGWAQGDFDGSGQIGFADFLILSEHFGEEFEQVPSRSESRRIDDPTSFQFSTLDLSVQLGTIPIQIERQFSTDMSERNGLFGFGWTLQGFDPRIVESAADGIGGAFSIDAPAFIPDETKIYLTSPEDGRRLSFTYEETDTGTFSFLGERQCVPGLHADPGVYAQLFSPSETVPCFTGNPSLGDRFNPTAYTLRTADGRLYDYDQTDGLSRITDVNDNVVAVSRDAIRNEATQEQVLLFYENDRIDRIVDPSGNELNYDYDDAGRLEFFTNQLGEREEYRYRPDSALLDSVLDDDGEIIATFSYTTDEQGELIFEGSFDAEGNRLDRREFDRDANIAVFRDANNHATTIIYDDRGNVTTEIDATGRKTIRRYDDPLNPDLETIIIDRRDFVTEQRFDDQGNLDAILNLGHVDDPFEIPIETGLSFNDDNNLTSITDGRGNTTVFRYEGLLLDEIENARGNIASFGYYPNGDVESFTDFRGNASQFFDYENGSPQRIVFADSTEQRLDYNQFGQTTYEAFFEADGTLVQERRSEFDAAGRLIKEIAGSDADGSKTARRLFYEGDLLDWEIIVHPDSLDADGNLTESPTTPVADRHSSITVYEYDAASRLIRQIDAEGGVIDFRYDAQGNRVALRDPVGNITTWLYDALNRPVEERDPLFWEDISTSTPQFEALSPDAFFELVAPVSANGGDDPLYDDPSGASCDTMTGAEHVILTCYDAAGNEAMTIDRNGRRREFDYEFDGELAQERWYDLEGDLIRTMNFGYDAARNLDFASDPDSTYVFTYDSLNQLDTVDNAGTPRVPNIVLDYQFDAQGNPESVSDNLGVTVGSEYNARNLLEHRQWFDASGNDAISPLRVDFLYNAAGRISDMFRYADLDASVLVGQAHRGYDLAGRSDAISFNDAVDDVLAAYDFGYDELGRMDEDSRAGITSTYGYDLTGQLTSATRSNGNNESFSYDANGNRTLPGYVTGVGNRLETDGTFTYGYDGEGNRISRTEIDTGKITRYEYDHRNRLTRITEQEVGGEKVELAAYTYDALNRRIIIDTSEGVTITVYDREQAWADFDEAGNVVTRYLYDDQIDFLLAMVETGEEPTFVNTDHLGSVVGYVDHDGALLNTLAYQSFGGLADGILAGRFGFTGREYDAPTDLYFYRARFYDPLSGRFIGEDPIRYEANDTNLHRFVSNNPLDRRDPTGTVSAISYGGIAAATAAVETVNLAASDRLACAPYYAPLAGAAAIPIVLVSVVVPAPYGIIFSIVLGGFLDLTFSMSCDLFLQFDR